MCRSPNSECVHDELSRSSSYTPIDVWDSKSNVKISIFLITIFSLNDLKELLKSSDKEAVIAHLKSLLRVCVAFLESCSIRDLQEPYSDATDDEKKLFYTHIAPIKKSSSDSLSSLDNSADPNKNHQQQQQHQQQNAETAGPFRFVDMFKLLQYELFNIEHLKVAAKHFKFQITQKLNPNAKVFMDGSSSPSKSPRRSQSSFNALSLQPLSVPTSPNTQRFAKLSSEKHIVMAKPSQLTFSK